MPPHSCTPSPQAPCGTPLPAPASARPPRQHWGAVGGCSPPKVLLPGGRGSSAVGGPGGAPAATPPAPPGPLQLLTDTTKPTRTRGKTAKKIKGQQKSWGGVWGGKWPPQRPAAPTIRDAWHKIVSSQLKKRQENPQNPKSGPEFGDKGGNTGRSPQPGQTQRAGGVHQPSTPMGWGLPCHHCAPRAPTLL